MAAALLHAPAPATAPATAPAAAPAPVLASASVRGAPRATPRTACPQAAAADPAVEPLRRANPHRYRDVRPGHLAVVAGGGRPWFIGRVCDVTRRPWGRTPCFVQVIDVDSGEIERIPAAWIVELMSDRGLGVPRPRPGHAQRPANAARTRGRSSQ